ncbi:hypothetical protein [Luteolibacter sp. AS25]|uniref:hypothetical protein n=1 Tax=Luteolibacter sp. AS25 TaxID=3135776 RepID=UPI00398AA9F6
MKWSWKSFFIHLVAVFIAALGVSFLVSLVIDAQRDTNSTDSTVISMAFGGVLTTVLYSLIGGWKGWNLKMLLIVGFLVTGLYSGNLVFGILAVVMSSIGYFISSKARGLITYYAIPKEEPHTDQEPQPLDDKSKGEQVGDGDAEESV